MKCSNMQKKRNSLGVLPRARVRFNAKKHKKTPWITNGILILILITEINYIKTLNSLELIQ